MAAEISTDLLQVDHLVKHFPVTKGLVLQRTVGQVRAVDDISFTVKRGETLALVGESGCGKTTTAKLVLRLERPTSGSVWIGGKDVHKLEGGDLRRYREDVQAVFQDPWSSLNPRLRVRDIISETLVVNEKVPKKEVDERVSQLLERVGLRPQVASLFPHEFSGGQRQRVAIARALFPKPQLILADEPTGNLAPANKTHILDLLFDQAGATGATLVMVTHDHALLDRFEQVIDFEQFHMTEDINA